jgi:hypothetical protein
MFELLRTVKDPKHRLALLVAMAVDVTQIVAFPFFAEGGVSPLDTALDVVTAWVLIKLLGWHWAFIPTFFAELVPGLDLFPTWTAAVFYVSRQRIRSGEPEIIPPGHTEENQRRSIPSA